MKDDASCPPPQSPNYNDWTTTRPSCRQPPWEDQPSPTRPPLPHPRQVRRDAGRFLLLSTEREAGRCSSRRRSSTLSHVTLLTRNLPTPSSGSRSNGQVTRPSSTGSSSSIVGWLVLRSCSKVCFGLATYARDTSVASGSTCESDESLRGRGILTFEDELVDGEKIGWVLGPTVRSLERSQRW